MAGAATGRGFIHSTVADLYVVRYLMGVKLAEMDRAESFETSG